MHMHAHDDDACMTYSVGDGVGGCGHSSEGWRGDGVSIEGGGEGHVTTLAPLNQTNRLQKHNNVNNRVNVYHHVRKNNFTKSHDMQCG